MDKRKIAIGSGVVFGMIVIGSVLSSDDKDTTTVETTVVETTVVETTTVETTVETTTTAPEISEADIELMAIQATLDLSELCPLIKQVENAGLTRQQTVAVAITEYENGYGKRLQPQSRVWLEDQLMNC
jgi:hypothetical protein